MTNSIASAKCPSVLSSGNYGMSQNRYTDESKEYIFVKLTDSAYRAVEEYQRNENAKRFTNGQCPKIQVSGNSGVIYFPTVDSSEGRKFGFTIDDVEGSLECIQQTPQGLDVLGSLAYRMRIHANDDIYDTTRTKMAIAEETEKSKCIREIKPNQTDIGRKVKKPVPSFHHHGGNSGNNSNSNSSSYLSNSSNRSKLVSLSNSPPLNGGSIKLGTTASSRSPNPTTLGGSGTVGGFSSMNSRHGSHTSSANLYSQSNVSSSLPSLTSASSLSSTLAGGIATGYASASTNSPPEQTTSLGNGKSKPGGGNSNFLGGGAGARGTGMGASFSGSKGSNGSGKGSGSASSAAGGSKLPDISRRKIRERLIHLLALKPFKKPELYARLQNEGLRDRERSLISNILKDIATLSRDNTYNLRRQMWNDVNENWPYYTEQELQQLKRRKPQNLTPPLSSDAGSSTSGQSPTSTHTGSPPPLGGSSGGGGLKRASLEYDDTFVSGVQPKKQRISHFKSNATSAPVPAGVGLGTGRMGYGNTSSGYAQQSRSATYSPHGAHNLQAADDNSGNVDLSFNVLNNVDDFMSHVEQSSYYGGNYARKSNGSGNGSNASNKSTANLKEKRSSGGSSTSSALLNTSFGSQECDNNNSGGSGNSSSRNVIKKAPNSANYGVNFVPESKSSGANRNGGGSTAGGNYRQQSPISTQQQQHHKAGNSVIYSPKMHSQASPHDEPSSTSRSSSRHQPPTRSTTKPTRTPTPPMLQQSQSQQQQHSSHHYHYQQQQQQSQMHSSQAPPPQQAQQPPHHHQQHSASPTTQKIADAASSYGTTSAADAAEKPCYDFSNYTPITSIEQRRQYKTEFERDYDEYRQLLERIEDVRRNFQVLAEQLHRAPQGCSDYENIKQQIVSEYERINNEEELKRDKQRFDYLHAKLAHIKQLVTDYDKHLTSMAAEAAARQQQLQQQQRQFGSSRDYGTQGSTENVDATVLAAHNARVSPMVSSESNNSPPSYQHQPQYQQQLSAHYNQHHHDAETIQHYHHPATQHTPPTEHSPPSNSSTAQQQQQQHQQQKHYNGHHTSHVNSDQTRHQQHHNNDSDTEDSSDSNSNDDDDDDDDDDDSNSNSNDDDDDNDRY